jgi:predicted O-methyltransferase YrrM
MTVLLSRPDTHPPALSEYYRSRGLSEDAWHVGAEHPSLENLALDILASTRRTRILEIGVQAGGFAVPVILSSSSRAGFSYLGVDNLAYSNAVALQLISEYLRLHGLVENIRFVEGDSTPVVRAAARKSFDLVLLDHYKPKYALDLYDICARDLLSDDGAIVLHDVLANAASAWAVCQRVCRAFGYTWTVDATVTHGAAIIRRANASASRFAEFLAYAEVAARWQMHTTMLAGRRSVGRVLRAVNLR